MFAFVFPGQGSQRVGMGRALAESHPIARRVFEEADEALGFSLAKLCWEGPEDELDLTANSQPAILTTSMAALRVLEQESGLSPVVVAGHSLGEFSALACAQALRFDDAVRIVHQRGRFMQEAVAPGMGAMVAVMGVGASDVEQLCADVARETGQEISAANFNGPAQTVVAGSAGAVTRLSELAQERSWMVRPLRVSAPFHCALMEPAADQLREVLTSVRLTKPVVPVLSNVNAQPHEDAGSILELLVRQVTAPVRWESCVRYLASVGVRQVVEIGEGKTLSSMIRRIDESMAIEQAGAPDDIEALRERAQSDLKAFVGPIGEWSRANDGSLYSAASSKVVWADTGRAEWLDEGLWTIHPSGTKVRKFGGLRIVWPDGKLEVSSPSEWRPRGDGSFMKHDWSALVHRDGRVEAFDLAEWDITDGGTMKKKDGTRVIWPEGLEWDFYDHFAHGF